MGSTREYLKYIALVEGALLVVPFVLSIFTGSISLMTLFGAMWCLSLLTTIVYDLARSRLAEHRRDVQMRVEGAVIFYGLSTLAAIATLAVASIYLGSVMSIAVLDVPVGMTADWSYLVIGIAHGVTLPATWIVCQFLNGTSRDIRLFKKD